MRVIVLGAGPAGLGAALGLARRGFEVDVVERGERVGGNAGSFEVEGIRADYGSHRLHPATDPQILAEIRSLLGDDLLERPRHGRIHLQGRWIHFPLRAADLALRMPPRFALGVAADLLRKGGARPAAGPAHGRETFASVLEAGLGTTICQGFYFPYARKIWGIAPHEIAAAQAHRRVSANSIGAMLRRLLPGGTGSGAASGRGRFFYPRAGFGQISEAYCAAARAAGARIHLRTRAHSVVRTEGGFRVELESRGGEAPPPLTATRVWSMIPNTALVRALRPQAPPEVEQAARSLALRAMILVYLLVDIDRFSEYDAHYFPAEDIPFTRVSEVKNYAARAEPAGRTLLCAEIPCATQDALWSSDDEALGARVAEGLARAGLPLPRPARRVLTRRLPAAYPIYREGWDEAFARIDGWLSQIDGLLSFGRQGLFAHDNTHHALAMAHGALACLGDDGRWDVAGWRAQRKRFESHVVED